MSYNIAYTSQFGDPDGILWKVDIYRNGYTGNPAEIGLDAEQPVIIEWQETKLQDAVCPSQCTLKVINDSDRLMVPLMTDDYVYCKIYRDNKLYWTGVLDQGVYEEPYSYNDGYITEITFSDFGALNRFDFNPFSSPGKAGYVASLYDIVTLALNLILIDAKDLSQNVSMILPGWGGNTAHLHHLYVNSRRFEGMTYRDVLEEILRPLSYRIVQRNGRVYVYDTEWMYDNAAVTPVEWMGDDARLSGGETYGKIELTFDRKSEPVIADGTLDPEDKGFKDSSRYYALYKDDTIEWGAAFFVDGIDQCFSGKKPVKIISDGKLTRLRGKYMPIQDACIARMIRVWDHNGNVHRNPLNTQFIYYHEAGYGGDNIDELSELFSIESGFIPKIKDNVYNQYQLRVSHDILLSPKLNPFDSRDNNPLSEKQWKKWNRLQLVYIPAKLELLDKNGDVVKHCKSGVWEDGAGNLEDMMISFYNQQGSCPCGGDWVSNRPQRFSIYSTEGVFRRNAGEYVPLPPIQGRLRLTISNGMGIDTEGSNTWFGNTPEDNWLSDMSGEIRWQLYRNPKITVVKSIVVRDDVDVDEICVEHKDISSH